MKTTPSPINRTLEADVVVIGAGGAGLCAAVQAAEKGARVIVLEKQAHPGGNTALAHQFFAAESPAQKRMNIKADKDVLFKYAMEWHHWRVDPGIVRAFINKTDETCEWLENQGLQISDVTAPSGPDAYRVGHRADGISIVKVLTKSIEKLGILVLYQVSAKEILIGKKGNITGIIASGTDRTYNIVAKAVIIASGGYGANKRLLRKYYPNYTSEGVKYIGSPGLTGDGIKMASKVGAAGDGIALFHIEGPLFSGMRLVNSINRRPEAIWMNKYGKRYCDECIVFDLGTRANAVDRQPDKISYTIIDERMKNDIIKENTSRTVGHLSSITSGPDWNDLTKELKIETEKGNVKIANSWDEVARWIEIAPPIIKATIDEYNSGCVKGYDELFLKDPKYLKPLSTPPFYVLKCNQALLDTMGGIKVNDNMEVLGKTERAIPGLYAAGVCVGGFESETYCYKLTGSMLSFALNSGRIAAENVIGYLLRNHLT